MIRAWCYPSGLIEFGRRVPKGAVVIARGPEPELRAYIGVKSRRMTTSRGRRTPATYLLVPGLPEADSAVAAAAALTRWTRWIALHAPKGIRVLPR